MNRKHLGLGPSIAFSQDVQIKLHDVEKEYMHFKTNWNGVHSRWPFECWVSFPLVDRCAIFCNSCTKLPLYAFQKCPIFHWHQSSSTPCSIDVQPNAMLFTHIGYLVDGIECTKHGRTACCRHHEWHGTFALCTFDFTFQVINHHFPTNACFYLVHVIWTQSHKRCQFFHGIMCILWGEQN